MTEQVTEQAKLPVQVGYLTGLDYPEPVASAITTYESAHEAWRQEQAGLAIALGAVDAAKDADQGALRAAVAAGKADPGGKHETKARSAITFAEERCRVAREAATTAADQLKAAIDTAGAQLIPLVLANMRAKAEAFLAEVTDSRQRIERAKHAMRGTYFGLTMLTKVIERECGGLRIHLDSASVPEIRWPTNPEVEALATVTKYEKQLLQGVWGDREGAKPSGPGLSQAPGKA